MFSGEAGTFIEIYHSWGRKENLMLCKVSVVPTFSY